MANMTLAIPDELYKDMFVHSEIKWSEVARQAFIMKIRELHWMDEALKNSELTEKDALEIGEKIKEDIWKRFKK